MGERKANPIKPSQSNLYQFNLKVDTRRYINHTVNISTHGIDQNLLDLAQLESDYSKKTYKLLNNLVNKVNDASAHKLEKLLGGDEYDPQLKGNDCIVLENKRSTLELYYDGLMKTRRMRFNIDGVDLGLLSKSDVCFEIEKLTKKTYRDEVLIAEYMDTMTDIAQEDHKVLNNLVEILSEHSDSIFTDLTKERIDGVLGMFKYSIIREPKWPAKSTFTGVKVEIDIPNAITKMSKSINLADFYKGIKRYVKQLP